MSTGERDLQRLLAHLSPRLSEARFAFEAAAGADLGPGTFALIREEEGLTAIRQDEAGSWARISLGVHSDLSGVGLTAALSERLARAGISVNVVAGTFHDHFLVPWDRRKEALELLQPPSG